MNLNKTQHHGCSVRALTGFHNRTLFMSKESIRAVVQERSPDLPYNPFRFVRTKVTDDEVIATHVGGIIWELVNDPSNDGFRSGGLEMLLGYECNPDSEVTADHHEVEWCAGPALQSVVRRLDLGRVFLGEWTSGSGGSTSQLRTVVWDLPAKCKLDLTSEHRDPDHLSWWVAAGYDHQEQRSKW